MSLTNDQLLALILENKNAIANLDGTGGGGGTPSTSSAIDEQWNTISQLLVNYLQSNELYADIIAAGSVNASNAWAKYLEALNIVVTNLKADVISVSTLDADSVNALIGTYLELHADTLFADYIKATDIAVETLSVTDLFARVGQFLSLITQTIDAAGVAAFSITSDHITISDAFIKNAMIESINAAKITSGTISTNKVTLKSDDGAMVIADGTITIKDNKRVRVQIGKDANDDYNMVVVDAQGKVMWSALGIEAAAIKSAIIIDDMIAPNANISADKINIAALVTSLNSHGGITTKSSNIIIDANNQTLSTWFQTLDEWQTDIGTLLSTHTTSIETMQGQISTLLQDTSIETVQGGLSQLQDKYTSLKSTVDGISTTVSSHTTNINDLTNNVASAQTSITTLEQTVSGLSAHITTTDSDVTALGNRTTQLETTVTAQGDSISTLQTKTYVDTTTYNTTIQSMQTSIDSIPGQITAKVSEQVSELGIDPDDYVTKTEQNQYLVFDTNGLHLGTTTSGIKLDIKNDGITFVDAESNELASWNTSEFHVPNIRVDVGKYARFGNFGFVPRGDGSLAFVKFGG